MTGAPKLMIEKARTVWLWEGGVHDALRVLVIFYSVETDRYQIPGLAAGAVGRRTGRAQQGNTCWAQLVLLDVFLPLIPFVVLRWRISRLRAEL